jgi:hypothetical protein
MKASELRIDNLIYGIVINADDIELKRVCEVITLDVSGSNDNFIHVYSDDESEQFDYFSPIPLTEEWLLKFGFSCEVKISSQMGTDGVEFRVYNLGKFTFNTNHGWWYSVIHLRVTPLDYVHQIQNLYFALTGEELKQQEQ